MTTDIAQIALVIIGSIVLFGVVLNYVINNQITNYRQRKYERLQTAKRAQELADIKAGKLRTQDSDFDSFTISYYRRSDTEKFDLFLYELWLRLRELEKQTNKAQ